MPKPHLREGSPFFGPWLRAARPALAQTASANLCFLNDEAGAVTVDWVVLTAAIFALGVMVFVPVFTSSSGVANVIAGDVVAAVGR